MATWAAACGGHLSLGRSSHDGPGYPPDPGTDDVGSGGCNWNDAAEWAAAALADSGTVKGAQRAIEKTVRSYGRVRPSGEHIVLIMRVPMQSSAPERESAGKSTSAGP